MPFCHPSPGAQAGAPPGRAPPAARGSPWGGTRGRASSGAEKIPVYPFEVVEGAEADHHPAATAPGVLDLDR